MSGAVIAPTREAARSLAFGRFRYVEFVSVRRLLALSFWQDVNGYIRVARYLMGSGERRYDLIVASGLFKTAVAGVILKHLVHLPLVIELSVVPRKIILFRSPRAFAFKHIYAWLYERAASVILSHADHIKQIFPNQTAQISPRLACKPCSAFPDFTPISAIEPSGKEKYLLLIGTPLYLKGADIAIRAFRSLLPTFASERLLIVGSALGFKDLAQLIAPGDPIELIDYLPYKQAIEHIRSAKIVLIPSRTDAMPRVAVEAMAAGKAIVASRVDGMGHYLEHDSTALLYEGEDHVALANQIRELLVNAELRHRLGRKAREVADREFSEQLFVRNYMAMVHRCLSPHGFTD